MNAVFLRSIVIVVDNVKEQLWQSKGADPRRQEETLSRATVPGQPWPRTRRHSWTSSLALLAMAPG